MTTIGTAVLQIIPSLKGVSDAIEKQIDGKVVEVKVAPKVDKTAATKAGKEAGETIAKEAKAAVSKGEIGKAVTDDIRVSVKKAAPGKEIAKVVTEDVKKSSPGREIAKVIVDGLADGVKQGLPIGSVGSVLADKLADGIKQGIDTNGLGTQIVGSIGRVIKAGNLAGTIKDAVTPGINQIGTQLRDGSSEWSKGIADSLRSGDIEGATDEIASKVKGTTDIIATIGSAFGANTDGIRAFGDQAGGYIGDFGGKVIETVGAVKGISDAFGLLGPAAKAGADAAIANLGPFAAAVAAAFEGFQKLKDFSISQDKNGNRAWGDLLLGWNVNDQVSPPPRPTAGVPQGPLPTGGAPVLPAAPQPSSPNPPPKSITDLLLGPGHATGGQIDGPGTGTSDSILLRASRGEFMVNADATRKNLPLLEIINSGKIPGFAGGGLVAGDQQLRQIIMQRFGISDIGGYRPADKYGEHSTGRALDVMVGNNKAKGDAVKDFALANASAIDLKWAIWRQHLYYPGGGGYDMPDRGSPTQNHMDHVHIFSGTGITNGLRGALAGGPGAGIAAGVGIPAKVGGPGAEDTSSSDQTGSAGSSSGGGGVSLASSFSGLGSMGLDSLGSGVGTTGSGSDLSLFGKAAGSAVSGQISSALGVFGVNDSPGWLKAASQLVGGIKVSDKSTGKSIFDGSNLFGGGRSAAPVAATSTGTGTGTGTPSPADGMAHGSRAGQAPGPQVVYNIRTATTEDAFLQAQRREKERAATKLSVF